MQEVKEQEKSIEPTIPFALYCIECSFRVANKAYESCLVINPYVLSFSTDEECANVVKVYELYKSKYCSCEIKDNACINCGGIVGYTVLQPCNSCLESQNNGNFIIFYANSVKLGPFDLNSCTNEINTEEYLADR